MTGDLNATFGHRPPQKKAALRCFRKQHKCAVLSPILPAVFHTMSALSAPAGHLPLEGKADDTGIPSSKMAAKPSSCGEGYSCSAVLLIVMRRTSASYF